MLSYRSNAGYMSVKSCSSLIPIIDLFYTSDGTGHQSFILRPVTGTSLFTGPITITNLGRPTCASTVSAVSDACAAAGTMLVGTASAAAANWLLEPSDQPGLYYVANSVRAVVCHEEFGVRAASAVMRRCAIFAVSGR